MSKEKTNTAVAVVAQPSRGGGLINSIVESSKNLVQRFQPEQLKGTVAAAEAIEAQEERLEQLEADYELLEKQQKEALWDDTACAAIEERLSKNAQERKRIEGRLAVLQQAHEKLMREEEQAAIENLVDESNGLQLAVEKLILTEYVRAARRIAMIAALSEDVEKRRLRTKAVADPAGLGGNMKWLKRMLPRHCDFFSSVTLPDPRSEKRCIWWHSGSPALNGPTQGKEGIDVAKYVELLLTSDSPEKVLEQMVSENPEKD